MAKEKWSHLQEPIYERELKVVTKALENSGATNIEAIILLSEDTNQVVYPPQYLINFQGEIDWKKYCSYFYD